MRFRAIITLCLCAGFYSCAQDSPRFATEVVSFQPGPGSGHGYDLLPDVVLGPPHGAGPYAGSLHVLSLGIGGSITLSTGDSTILDGPGPDFIIFENAFYAGNTKSFVFAELAGVELSADGEEWVAYPCNFKSENTDDWHGCAGWRPVMPLAEGSLSTLDPETVGGDPFDLADLGLREARFIRITDLSGEGASPIAGFDLDAVGLINWQ